MAKDEEWQEESYKCIDEYSRSLISGNGFSRNGAKPKCVERQHTLRVRILCRALLSGGEGLDPKVSGTSE
jgi:hypothetical protein